MSKSGGQQMMRGADGQGQQRREGGSGQLEGLPLQSSPYVKYSDLEEYKRQGYGTEGHVEPVDKGRGGGSTDGPTLSGSNLTPAQAKVVDSLHRGGAP